MNELWWALKICIWRLYKTPDEIEWGTYRDSYKEILIREVKGIKSCSDCIFRHWGTSSKACKGCDGTPKGWGDSDPEDLALARRILSK